MFRKQIRNNYGITERTRGELHDHGSSSASVLDSASNSAASASSAASS